MAILAKVWAFLIDSLQTILLAASVFLVIYIFLFRPFQVSGQSMFPNFLDKEYVLTNIVGLHFKQPHLGDVVVFKAPPDPEKDYIKRIIGVAGDTVEVRDGSIYLNGKLLDESKYLKNTVKTNGGAYLGENQPRKVPDGDFFVLGDNRTASSDSREWGFVTKDAIIGLSMFVYWPVSDMKFIRNPYN